MSRFNANSSFMRQIRAAEAQHKRAMEHDNERERLYRSRCAAAGVDPEAKDAPLIAARHLFKDTIFQNAPLQFTSERLWVGEGRIGNGLKHQAGFGLSAMQACVQAWPDEFAWLVDRPAPDVVLSIRDWLEPTDRWSWDVRRTGDAPADQPSFW
jgi:hypothetical protein